VAATVRNQQLLTDEPLMRRDNIIVFGRSLGGAVAIDLIASRGHEVRGLAALAAARPQSVGTRLLPAAS